MLEVFCGCQKEKEKLSVPIQKGFQDILFGRGRNKNQGEQICHHVPCARQRKNTNVCMCVWLTHAHAYVAARVRPRDQRHPRRWGRAGCEARLVTFTCMLPTWLYCRTTRTTQSTTLQGHRESSTAVHPCRGTGRGNKNQQATDTCSNLEKSPGNHTKGQNQSPDVTRYRIPFI